MPDLELVIDELVLHGFAATDRATIGDAVEAELARRLAKLDHSALGRLGQVGQLDAGSFNVDGGAKPAAIGAGIASSIIDGAIGRPR